MARIICVDIPLLPLQILLKRNPGWGDKPVAVITEDKPLGIILFLNKKARKNGIQPGMKYATALSVAPGLLAGVVDEEEMKNHAAGIEKKLLDFSPEVEIAGIEDGVFWVKADGMSNIFSSENEMLDSIRAGMTGLGFSSRCGVGSSKPGSFCAARSSDGKRIVHTDRQERDVIENLPLIALPIDGRTYRLFSILSLKRVGELLSFSEGSVLKRFGEHVRSLYRFLSGAGSDHIQPLEIRENMMIEQRYIHPSSTVVHLIERIKPLIERVIEEARKDGCTVHSLFFRFNGEDGESFSEAIIPVEPTRDGDVFFRLINMRFEGKHSFPPINGVELLPHFVKLSGGQYSLTGIDSHRNLETGAEAFSLIRAELGNDAIQAARIDPEHAPERRFHWERMFRPIIPSPEMKTGNNRDNTFNLCRTFYRRDHTSEKQTHPVRESVDMCKEFAAKNVDQRDIVAGPYVISGKWWEEEDDRIVTLIEGDSGRTYWVQHRRESGGSELLGWIE